MKRAALAALALIGAAGLAHAQNLSADDIGRRTVERRAVEAVIWGMPAYQAMVRQTQGAWNQIVYWSSPSLISHSSLCWTTIYRV